MKHRLLGRTILAIEVVILLGVIIHTPLSVWFGTLWPEHGALIKSWKELLMGVGALLIVIYITRTHHWRDLWRDWVIRLTAAYALLHLLLLGWMSQGAVVAGAGLLIDLRYILFFVMMYTTARYIADARRSIVTTALAGAIIVAGFATLQVTVLPDDILTHIGYSQQTISPYLTVDQNPDYVRINSTLRGPNPLGAYASMCLVLATAYVLRRREALTRMQAVIGCVVIAGSMVAVWASYSRSAVAVAAVMAFTVASLTSTKYIKRYWWVGVAIACLVGIGAMILMQDRVFVSNVVLHENPNGGSAHTSNDGHIDSLHDGTARMMRQPLGGGIGSTGSASLYGDRPLIIENQYLFIAHEVGWVGLALFMILFGTVIWRLWQRRADWLALGLCVSGIGMAVIGLLLPVWVDDTVALAWWGIAGLAIGQPRRVHGKDRTRH
ncbi:MAG: hypothetical protein WAS27_01870 [Candidatus Saccharimonadales bacterium]